MTGDFGRKGGLPVPVPARSGMRRVQRGESHPYPSAIGADVRDRSFTTNNFKSKSMENKITFFYKFWNCPAHNPKSRIQSNNMVAWVRPTKVKAGEGGASLAQLHCFGSFSRSRPQSHRMMIGTGCRRCVLRLPS